VQSLLQKNMSFKASSMHATLIGNNRLRSCTIVG
jgi:hypothetical protein